MTDSQGTLRSSSHRRTTLAACLAAGSLALTACGSGVSTESSGARNADSTRSLADTITAATLGGAGAAGAVPVSADVARKTARPEAPAQLMVDGVRIASHEGYDRIVFDLVGDGTPGWFMDYTTSPTQQGSGRPVEFRGSVALNVNIDGTVYPFELGRNDPGIGTVRGAGNVTEVISAGTFEGHSQFVVGLKEKLPYSVEVLRDPNRVVIDVLHR